MSNRHTLDKRVNFFVNEEIEKMIAKLLETNPEYINSSHVIRVAIIRLFNKEIKGK